MKTLLKSGALLAAAAAMMGATTAADAASITFTDRATFESAITISFNENFETLGPGTIPFTGPALMPTGITVSSPSNNLFTVGIGQSTNPTEAIGSNFPMDDTLNVALGGTFFAIGLDLFQNAGGGSQYGFDIAFDISLMLGAVLVETLTATVAPDGGSFFGAISTAAFDNIVIFATPTGAFEVIDNVTVGNAAVPAPATLALLGLGLAGLGVARRRKAA